MSDENKVDDILDSLKGSLESCIVMGFDKDGKYVMSSTVANVPMLHWMFNKGIFEMHLFEKKNEAQVATPDEGEGKDESSSDTD